MKREQILLSLSLALAALLSLTPNAKADTYQTYNLAWSGAPFGSLDGAAATGVITLDLTTLIITTEGDSLHAPGSLGETGYFDIINDITSLSVTVTGAGAGNGTFTKANLCACSYYGSDTYWSTFGNTINMQGNILAQLTADHGDFNLFFTSPGPQGGDPLTLFTDALGGLPMVMTEFAPVATPEPGTISLILTGVGLLRLMMATRKRISLGPRQAS